jgi:hypothetical protein
VPEHPRSNLTETYYLSRQTPSRGKIRIGAVVMAPRVFFTIALPLYLSQEILTPVSLPK